MVDNNVDRDSEIGKIAEECRQLSNHSSGVLHVEGLDVADSEKVLCVDSHTRYPTGGTTGILRGLQNKQLCFHTARSD